MAKKAKVFAEEIQSRMQAKGKPVMTMLWRDFYELAEIERLRDERADRIREACSALGIVVGHGKNVVTFCHDANFAS